ELAANALGVCEDAVGLAMNFARTRQRGGKLAIGHQLIQLKLNEMHMLTEALRSFVMRVAAESEDTTAPLSTHSHFLMNFATDAIQRVCYLNMDIHGRTGSGTMNAAADKLVRDAIIWTHIAGDAVQRLRAVATLIK
ncbi:MAG: acyl-CoA dehydrogenase family protein, partial [Burkholderiales bacterium]|nr:acyl-CoA dehydrogenase family protein [Burkholderiales bacterium]